MNALMTIGQQAITMTSREIAEICDKRHDHVMVDCRKLADFYAETYSPEKSGQFVKSSTYIDSTGRALPCFELNKQACLDLVTGYSLPHRHAVNKRWQELESQQAPAVPQTMAQALRLAAEQAEHIEVQEAQLREAAPKVEYVDRYVAAQGAMGFRQVAKLLNAKEPEFRVFLEDKKILYRLGGVLTPYQNHIDAGRFAIKTGVSQSEHAYAQAKFTPKGVNWVAAEWAKHRVALAVEGKQVAA